MKVDDVRMAAILSVAQREWEPTDAVRMAIEDLCADLRDARVEIGRLRMPSQPFVPLSPVNVPGGVPIVVPTA